MQNNEILLNQNHDINYISKVLISPSRRSDSLILNENEKKIFQEKIGQLLWVCNQTRPDISFDASNVTSNLKNATILDLKRCNKVLSKITNYQIIIKYQKLNKNLRLFVNTDASFGNLKDGESQGLYLIFLADTDYHCNVLSWQAKRLKRIPRSSLAAETIAALEGVDAAIYIRDIFYELTCYQMPINLFTDNKSLYDAIKSSKYVENKRL